MKKIILAIIVCAVLIFLGRFFTRSLNCCSPEQFKEIAMQMTRDWKTYTDTKYGFEVKHPKDWVVSGKVDSPLGGFYYVNFGTTTNEGLVVLQVYPDQKSLDMFMKYFDGLDGIWEDVLIDGNPGKSLLANSKDIVLTLTIKDGNGYSIASTDKSIPGHDAAINMGLLLTFKK